MASSAHPVNVIVTPESQKQETYSRVSILKQQNYQLQEQEQHLLSIAPLPLQIIHDHLLHSGYTTAHFQDVLAEILNPRDIARAENEGFDMLLLDRNSTLRLLHTIRNRYGHEAQLSSFIQKDAAADRSKPHMQLFFLTIFYWVVLPFIAVTQLSQRLWLSHLQSNSLQQSCRPNISSPKANKTRSLKRLTIDTSMLNAYMTSLAQKPSAKSAKITQSESILEHASFSTCDARDTDYTLASMISHPPDHRYSTENPELDLNVQKLHTHTNETDYDAQPRTSSTDYVQLLSGTSLILWVWRNCLRIHHTHSKWSIAAYACLTYIIFQLFSTIHRFQFIATFELVQCFTAVVSYVILDAFRESFISENELKAMFLRKFTYRLQCLRCIFPGSEIIHQPASRISLQYNNSTPEPIQSSTGIRTALDLFNHIYSMRKSRSAQHWQHAIDLISLSLGVVQALLPSVACLMLSRELFLHSLLPWQHGLFKICCMLITVVCSTAMLRVMLGGLLHFYIYIRMLQQLGELVDIDAHTSSSKAFHMDLFIAGNIIAWKETRSILIQYLHAGSSTIYSLKNFNRHLIVAVVMFVILFTALSISLFNHTFCFSEFSILALWNCGLIFIIVITWLLLCANINLQLGAHINELRQHHFELVHMSFRLKSYICDSDDSMITSHQLPTSNLLSKSLASRSDFLNTYGSLDAHTSSQTAARTEGVRAGQQLSQSQSSVSSIEAMTTLKSLHDALKLLSSTIDFIEQAEMPLQLAGINISFSIVYSLLTALSAITLISIANFIDINI